LPAEAPRNWDTRRLRFATEAAGVALWSWDIATDEISLDDRACLMWGVPTSGPVTFEDLSARIHPEDLDRVRSGFAATREAPGPYEIDFRILYQEAVRWISARGHGDDEGVVGRLMYGVFLDVTARKLAEEGRAVLAEEMSHRVKNLFSIAAALTRISERVTTTPAELAEDLTRRLVALGRAHELIRPSLTRPTRAAALGELLAEILGAYDDRGTIGDRITVTCPQLPVGEGSVTTLALIIHELATNCLKYGALSSESGRLDITITTDGDAVILIWREMGGPPVEGPRGARGFGSYLVHSCVTEQLGGSIVSAWPPEGAIVTLRLDPGRLAA
jgi:two-component sensor histidine kinase